MSFFARIFFFCIWPHFFFGGGSCFSHFGATEKDLGYLGVWDCSPFLHRHTNVDQSHSGIAVHSTDKHHQARVSDDSGPPLFLCTSCKFVHKNEARRANKKKDAPCSTKAFQSERGGGAQKSDFVCGNHLCEGHAAEN